MTRINPTDQVLLLLQEQLNRLGKDRTVQRGQPAPVQSGTPEPMARLRALAGREGITDEDMKRALVRGLIVQQLGEAIGNDPAFEAIASDVARIIEESPAGRDLLDRAMRQLGTS
ncbi:hypothetical protein [Sphingomonas sp. ERG5]|uniref:hypothetical protein n=1 Tax=Sphingomonas sp. ERG5 TaxID=1381597 RepID=UPI00054C1A82|nr:hypothetical protein [Sphingomonas sp. ERG5]